MFDPLSSTSSVLVLICLPTWSEHVSIIFRTNVLTARTVSQYLRLGQHRLLAPRPITPSRVRARSCQAGLSSRRPEIQRSCHTPRSQSTCHGNLPPPCRTAVARNRQRQRQRCAALAPRTRVAFYCHVAHFRSSRIQRSSGELASYQQKMFRIDDHVGIAIAGLTSDARVLRSVPPTLSLP